jgi:hypothetical protein
MPMIRPMMTAFALAAILSLDAAGASLKFDLVDEVGWRGDRAATIGDPVEETYSYDEGADTVTIDVKFDRKGFAPVAPMLAVAARYGLAVQIEPSPTETGHLSVLGPLMGVEHADRYTLKFRGLGKYIAVRPTARSGEVSVDLQDRLEAEVDKIVQAGHLAPWLFLVNVPGSGADDRGDVYWRSPAETLYLLAEVAPLLSPKSRRSLVEYLKSERAAYPPESCRCVPLAEGARREYCPPGDRLLKKWEDKNLAWQTKSPPDIWSLYGLARYYELTGERPSREVMARCAEILARGVEYRDWATLYDRRGHTPAFNAVHGVNQRFAGLIGHIRLARLAGDKEAELLGWGLLARTAALRLAMGKYTQYMHDARLFNVRYDMHPSRGFKKAASQDLVIAVQADPAKYTLPADPAWWAKRRSGDWIGELVTWSWSRPIDDVRQVHRLDEKGVDVWEWCGTDCVGTGQKRDTSEAKEFWYMRLAPCLLPFCDMVPELGQFMADHLKAESRTYCDRVVENQPHWHITYAEAILSAEIGFNMPGDAYGQFLARAWILGESSEQLQRYIDVPWVPVGDLYYLHKIAVAVSAAASKPAPRSSAPSHSTSFEPAR